MKALAEKRQLQVTRFWGKIATRGKAWSDYYVCEALTSADPVKSRDERMIMEGIEGPNKYTYWVAKGPGPPEEWVQLPHVTPNQLSVAMATRRLLTGDLAAPVPSFPPMTPTPTFAKPSDVIVNENDGEREAIGDESVSVSTPAVESSSSSPPPRTSPLSSSLAPGYGDSGTGCEANLLRAIIAMVTADTALSLKGLIDSEPADEDRNKMFETIEPAEESEDVDFEALKVGARPPNFLRHTKKNIFQCCRFLHSTNDYFPFAVDFFSQYPRTPARSYTPSLTSLLQVAPDQWFFLSTKMALLSSRRTPINNFQNRFRRSDPSRMTRDR